MLYQYLAYAEAGGVWGGEREGEGGDGAGGTPPVPNQLETEKKKLKRSTPRNAQESPGAPRSAQGSLGEPRKARRAQDSPGEPRSAQERPGAPPKSAQESPGERKREP